MDLQFADDTIIMGAAHMENAWTIKRIIRNMEMTSGLKVNFEKCCLYGVNIGDSRLREMTEILGCRVGTLPFSYLGIKVGMDRRNTAEWSSVIQKNQKSCKELGR
ncbi:hypothetical protein ACS0TY_007170 [Phlomoides rotata]